MEQGRHTRLKIQRDTPSGVLWAWLTSPSLGPLYETDVFHSVLDNRSVIYPEVKGKCHNSVVSGFKHLVP